MDESYYSLVAKIEYYGKQVDYRKIDLILPDVLSCFNNLCYFSGVNLILNGINTQLEVDSSILLKRLVLGFSKYLLSTDRSELLERCNRVKDVLDAHEIGEEE